jgi:aspartate/methionine/tyrosine aminotransferase
MTLPDFQLETYFSRWEFVARYNLAASDAQSMSVAALLQLAPADARDALLQTHLGYTPTYGSPALRDAIAGTYERRVADDILCFAGAEEGIYVAMRVLLQRDDHAIVVIPNYQSAESIPLDICAVDAVPLDPSDGWSLDVDRVEAMIRPNTRVVSINFPHNPTGAVLDEARLGRLVEVCRRHGLWLFSDEVYRLLGATGSRVLPQVADIYERGLSLNVMSKAYGLAGLRIGWIACADRTIVQSMERLKHYLSICNAAPSEVLARIALEAREVILARHRERIDRNLTMLDAFFGRWTSLFEWQRPDAGCIAYPRYLRHEGVDAFCERLVEQAGVLLLPSSNYRSALGPTPVDRFRIGFGRDDALEAVAAMEEHLIKNACN